MQSIRLSASLMLIGILYRPGCWHQIQLCLPPMYIRLWVCTVDADGRALASGHQQILCGLVTNYAIGNIQVVNEGLNGLIRLYKKYVIFISCDTEYSFMSQIFTCCLGIPMLWHVCTFTAIKLSEFEIWFLTVKFRLWYLVMYWLGQRFLDILWGAQTNVLFVIELTQRYSTITQVFIFCIWPVYVVVLCTSTPFHDAMYGL